LAVRPKSGEGKIGHPDVSSLVGNISAHEHGRLITVGSFTTQAITYVRGKSNLRLIDGTTVINLILVHYEQFDSRYNGIVPLKRVYVPESRLPVQD
jgi:restriction system protein